MTRDQIIQIIESKMGKIFCTYESLEAIEWLKTFPVEATFEEIIKKLKNLEWALRWAEFVGDKEEMKSIILKSNDPEYAYHWATTIHDHHHKEMISIIMNSGNQYHIKRWKEWKEKKDE